MALKRTRGKVVLVCVLKNQRDLEVLLREGWYRIPAVNAPKLRADYLAFYQPASFGPFGKQIQYFSRVTSFKIKKGRWLLSATIKRPIKASAN